ncbi:flagellar biosynthetic protein FliR [Pseudorhodoferax sp. Leaf267]|uniref:flagellar biosynthetic protein FliR n=1 Tax=Pseudorhodoferax sp. Leaf267 TaxID=1736316 RepID=UPI0006F42BF1|nr:flagellar biosynthetic protein FliR [Pseudorhodoferax sp. Leaf267]KQP13793.1 flagellar biosynthetic protein FliR [Pseudorhodoferax sp. Leaf267]
MITFSEAQLVAWISPILWPFLRVLALFTSAPIFSMRAIPARARIGLAFLIAVAAQPSLVGQPVIGVNSPEALGAVVQQVGVGLTIGFAVRLVFAAVELAGELVGLQMGLNFAAFFDPMANAQVSAVSRFLGNMSMLLFIVINGHLMVLMAVVRSFDAFPTNGNFLVTLQRLQVHQLGAELFASALWIALPMIGLLLFVNLALGIVSRVAPQMNVFAVGFPITLVMGMIGIAATLPLMDQPLMALMERTLALFGPR